jgi:acyl carrier protein
MSTQELEAIKKSLGTILSDDVLNEAINSNNLLEEGFIDSFGVFELATHLENRLNITIPTECLDSKYFSSISNIETLCLKLIKTK